MPPIRRLEDFAVGTKLYVGNLSFDATQEDLQALFGEVGTCASVAVITDRDTGRSRGFGFVEMSSEEEAQAAIQRFDGHEHMGRQLRVNVANAREDRGGGRGRGNRRF